MDKYLIAILPWVVIFGGLPVGIKFLWSYLVKILFPGAVEQNLSTKEISWKVSIILAIILVLLKK